MNNTAILDYPPAEIGGPRTTELAGLHLSYDYETGRAYSLEFEAGHVTFLALRDPTAPPGYVHQPGRVPYMARRLRDSLYLVHWLVRSPELGNIHVALIVDLVQRELHVSAIMPKGFEFFDIAHMHEIRWPARGIQWTGPAAK